MKYQGWQALYLSFFSKDLYRSVVRDWKGIAFLYLFLLIFSTWLICCLRIYFAIDPVMQQVSSSILPKLPAITVKDGELQIDKPAPYTVYFDADNQPQMHKPVAYFDPTTDKVEGHDDIPFIMTKHYLIMAGPTHPSGSPSVEPSSAPSAEDSASTYELKNLGDMQLTQQSYRGFVDTIRTAIPIGVFAICMPFGFIFCAVQSLVFGAIGLAIAGAANIKLTYGELVRLAVVALTPGILLDLIMKMFFMSQLAGGMMMIFMLAIFAVEIGYLSFGVMANKANTPPLPSIDNQTV